MTLVWPAREYLASHVAALERGWSPDNERGAEAAREELAAIAANADAFLASVPRLPGCRRWMWDGELCGAIGFRSQRVIEANGGVLVEEFIKPPAFGSVRALRYRVML